MAKLTISKNELLMAVGLLTVGRAQLKLVNETLAVLGDLLGEDEECGHCFDAVYGDYDAKTLIKRLGVKVHG